jgi:cell division protein FtsW (lipid II flippase)
MSMDWLLWVVRAILIVVGIILAIMIWKGKKEGRYQRIHFRFFVIGITALILGIILLIISSVTDLSFFYSLYLIAAGAIGIIIGLVIRNTWEKNR